MNQIRQLVWEHITTVLPARVQEQANAEQRLQQLNTESDKLLQAHLADAVPVEQLKREQARIAAARAQCEAILARSTVEEERLHRILTDCCSVLQQAESHYLNGDRTVRRDLNQGVFERVYIDDDEIVGSDLTPAFQRLMSDTLEADLETERKTRQTLPVRTSDLRLVPKVSQTPARGGHTNRRDHAPRYLRTAPDARHRRYLRRERPQGSLPWERKNPGPFKVRGSNESILVAGAGLEPATLWL